MSKKIVSYVAVLLTCLMATPAMAGISPDTLDVTLAPGESISETKTVTITGVIPKADIIFAFDLTGSMGEEIDTAKAEAITIMTNLDSLIDDAQYGVMSFMDYPNYYTSCGYSAGYGNTGYGDYAYSLDQSITDDKTLVSNTINALSLGSGGDGPQDYTRIMYESYADPAVGYRSGSKKILILFGDNVPHDCDLNEEVLDTTVVFSTGEDPGRDEKLSTDPADTDGNLVLLDVLDEMAANNITLLTVWSEPYTGAGNIYQPYWDYWTSLTGGANYWLDNPLDLPAAIQALIEAEATHLDELALEGCDDWLTYVEPLSYTDINILPDETATFEFDIDITVPEDICEGIEGELTHACEISAMGDGASYGDQAVSITVVCEVTVDMDIKPGSCPNPLNPKSQGVLPVAVLGTEDFDVSTIDPATILLEGVAPIRYDYEDVATPFPGELCDCHDLNGDGYLDLTLKFSTPELVAALELGEGTGKPMPALPELYAGEAIPLTLTGNLKEEEGGTPISAQDCIRISNPGKKK